MGQIIKSLSKRNILSRTVFNNRFVIEVAEKVHFHYRNLRINLSLFDFLEMCKGCNDAYNRWQARGRPEPKEGQHIELCRKKVATFTYDDGIQINLNANLYNRNKDKIYAEGAGFSEKKYIHLKLRDLRIEMSVKEFEELADAVREAKKKLEDSNIGSMLQKT